MSIKNSDVLIVGAGLAGLRVALECARAGLKTTVLSLVPPKRSHSCAAQGGMQASLASSTMGEGDNEDLHFADTVIGSDWGCDQIVARMFAITAPKAVRELANMGVAWSRVSAGKKDIIINAQKTTIEEKNTSHGLINARDFGATTKWRTCYTADATGHSMLYAIANELLKYDVEILDRTEAIKLICDDDVCKGVVARNLISGELVAHTAKAVLIATGGYGRIYKHSTNAVICDGSGLGMAYEAGATLANMEAVQFHPTVLVPSGILLTEGCRGDGGVLRDVDGVRFMSEYEPRHKDLASRDVVSARIMQHIKRAKGVDSIHGKHVWLDITMLGKEHIDKNLKDVKEICKNFADIDVTDTSIDENGRCKGYIPVMPMQHFCMGGLRTKPSGESVKITGLFSAGEAACWDLHGFNRLGGNSVAETVVAGMIVGDEIIKFCQKTKNVVDENFVLQILKQEGLKIQNMLENKGNENVHELKSILGEIMWERVGIFRDETGLKQAVNEIKTLQKRAKNIKITSKSHGINPELEETYRLDKMLKIALCVAMGALNRKESRGAHKRSDYPQRDDKNFLNKTLFSYDTDKNEPKISYEILDIMSMEIAPKERGYESGGVTKHQDSDKREKQIQKITKELKAQGKNRYEIQDAIMPFRLDEKFKAPNERVGVGYE
ncbi:Fumarate reductase flavoprotein subunit [Campylobacter majalis]|uniref:succinate dehydrogenase n=1 Tax=Campylobacter majalis TaxID=2790656 RepID=A0ABM8QAG9_9BACT|nr:fumarate reductase flavoprotein subunit [Campylobacter majalis]CAD7289767.1 Fumarate reductase flavoprotein subunit [Campylobacter majalis]